MNLYGLLYFICLFGTVVSGAVSVFLFVRLDIKTALRVLGKRGKKKRTKAAKRNGKKRFGKLHVEKAGQKTVLLHLENKHFRVIREIVIVHTDETI